MSELTDTPSRSAGGQFLPGRSGNPAGRPRGSRNRATLLAALISEEQEAAIVQAVIDRAIAGHWPALRACFTRLLPPARPVIEIDLPPIASAEDVAEAGSALIAAVAAGEISPGEAQRVMRLLTAQIRLYTAARGTRDAARARLATPTTTARPVPGRAPPAAQRPAAAQAAAARPRPEALLSEVEACPELGRGGPVAPEPAQPSAATTQPPVAQADRAKPEPLPSFSGARPLAADEAAAPAPRAHDHDAAPQPCPEPVEWACISPVFYDISGHLPDQAPARPNATAGASRPPGLAEESTPPPMTAAAPRPSATLLPGFCALPSFAGRPAPSASLLPTFEEHSSPFSSLIITFAPRPSRPSLFLTGAEQGSPAPLHDATSWLRDPSCLCVNESAGRRRGAGRTPPGHDAFPGPVVAAARPRHPGTAQSACISPVSREAVVRREALLSSAEGARREEPVLCAAA